MNSKDVLLGIPSPRDVKRSIESLNEIDYVDKLWVKYMPEFDAYNTIRNFFLERKYDVLVISTDDIILPYFAVAQLIHDLQGHPEIGILSGVCNLGSPSRMSLLKKVKITAANLLHVRDSIPICDEVLDELYNLHHINVTFKPVVSSDSQKLMTLSQYRFPCSHVIFDEERMHKVWFQGFAPGAVRREVVERIAFRGYQEVKTRLDVSFALDCQNAGIEVYADFNVVLPHHQHYDEMRLGTNPSHSKFEPSQRQIQF